jgi:hypothetical protein
MGRDGGSGVLPRPVHAKPLVLSPLAAAGTQHVSWAVTDAISGHHRAAALATFAPVSSSDPAAPRGGIGFWLASDRDHQGEQTADDGSEYESQAHGENPRKDRCHQIGADTLPDGMRDVGYRVRVARPRDALRRTTMVL